MVPVLGMDVGDSLLNVLENVPGAGGGLLAAMEACDPADWPRIGAVGAALAAM
jgi:hypothetical protein